MGKSLDNPQVPWGWGSLQKGAGLAFGSHQPSPAEVALAFPCPWTRSLNPSSCLLVETSYKETFNVSQQGQPYTFLSPHSSPSRSMSLGCELKPFNRKPPVVHFLWTSSAFHDFFFLSNIPLRSRGWLGIESSDARTV